MTGFRRWGEAIVSPALFAALLTTTLFAVCAAPVLGQAKSAGQAKNAGQAKGGGQVKAAQRPPALPTPALQRLANMTPEQRQKALSRLPPDRRDRVEDQLGKLDRLPADQRAKLLQRYDEFQGLPRDRQATVRSELQALRKLPTPQLRERLNSPEFQEKFSPEEQRLLRESLVRQVQ
jgi:hypothetical protein